jgi:hypothetical protein
MSVHRPGFWNSKKGRMIKANARGTPVHISGSDRWFHLRWPIVEREELKTEHDNWIQHIKEHDNTIRYCLITKHDHECEIKPLKMATTTTPHYHAIVWVSNVTASTSMARTFKLHVWTDGDIPDYYCAPRYSMKEGFIDYVDKYDHVWEWGQRPLKVTEVSKSKKERDEMDLLALNLVKEGKIKYYADTYPLHHYRNINRIKGALNIQENFTQDRREFQSYWIYGESRTGKSQIVNALWPGAYVLRKGDYWDGHDPWNPDHRIVSCKDANSESILKGITVMGMKTLTDMDGQNINKKYKGGEVINCARAIFTSNHTISECLNGTGRDEMVNVCTEIEAIKNRFQEIHIKDFLKMVGYELKPTPILQALKGRQISDSMMLFNKVGPNTMPGYGEEKLPPPPPLTQEELEAIESEIYQKMAEEAAVAHEKKRKATANPEQHESKRHHSCMML